MLKRLILANVVPGPKLVWDKDQRRPVGYYQRFGVTSETHEQLLSIIREYVKRDLEGNVIEIEDSGEPDFGGSEADIAERVGDMTATGIWYVSGRAFYLDKDE